MHRHDDDHSAFIDLHVPGRARLGHLRGLDGLRGLAVAGVVAFHAGFGGMVGGYLGVSTFFTLSGFLIGSLLISSATPAPATDGGQGAPAAGPPPGTVDLRQFWSRRIRRLYPASVATLLLVLVLFAPLVATGEQLARLPGDAVAALANVANWRFIVEGTSYADLFTAPSPLLHFWSLAIEEQFYLVFPLVVALALRAARGRVRFLGMVLGALTVLSVGWTLFGGLSDDHIYLGTGTRASELLVGGILAVVLTDRRMRMRLALRRRWAPWATGLGAAALAVQLWWWWSLDQTAGWLYNGGFTVYALMTCLVIVAAAIPFGPVHLLLRWAPLRWLGSRSYAIYLIHWPLFLAVRQTWGDADRWVVTAVVVTASLGLAELSHNLLERPIRLGWRPRRGRGWAWGLGSAVAVVALAATVVPRIPTDDGPGFESQLERWEELQAAAATAPSDGTEPPSDPSADPAEPAAVEVPTVAAFGDSTVIGVDVGLAEWGKASGKLRHTLGDMRLGCGVVRYPSFLWEFEIELSEECRTYPERFRAALEQGQPDVALLVSSVWTTPDAIVPGQDTYSHIGDPVVDEFIRDQLLEAVDLLSSQGAFVVLVQWPQFGEWADDGRPDGVRRQMEPARMERMHELQEEVAAMRPDTAGVIDLAGWMGDRSQDRSVRDDGIHFDLGGFVEITEEWFGPELLRMWEEHEASRQ